MYILSFKIELLLVLIKTLVLVAFINRNILLWMLVQPFFVNYDTAGQYTYSSLELILLHLVKYFITKTIISATSSIITTFDAQGLTDSVPHAIIYIHEHLNNYIQTLHLINVII